MLFSESMDFETAYYNRISRIDKAIKSRFVPVRGIEKRATGKECRNAVLITENPYSANMVVVLVGNENGFHLRRIKLPLFHSQQQLLAINTCIDQYGFFFVANVITVPVTPRCQCTYFNHSSLLGQK
jgi:hypothetical protein